MNRQETKSRKEKLRRIQDHLHLAHENSGVESEQIGFVEVIHHPTYILPALNYVTPRRKTAMVPGKHVEEGLTILHKYRREARVVYIDGLYPPFFADSLEKIGLSLKDKVPLWVFEPDQTGDYPHLPDDISVTTVRNEDGIAIWSLVWRNSGFQVSSNPLEPLQVGRFQDDSKETLDVILYHHDTPIAVARMTLSDGCAHIMARATVETSDPRRLDQWLLESAVVTAHQLGYDLIFLCADLNEAVEFDVMTCTLEGSMLCYSNRTDPAHGEPDYESVEQSILLP